MQEKLNDWGRLESVIKWANMTPNYFARYIGLARGENLYQIKRGKYGISRKTASMVVDKFPQVNMMWLLCGDGDMLAGAEYRGASKPLYNVGVEERIREIDSLEPDEQIMLPSNIDFDLGILYLGHAMQKTTPPNTVILLKKILPEMIIPGSECVIVTKKIVLLRIAKIEQVSGEDTIFRLATNKDDPHGDLVININEIERAYVVKAKILTNI